MAGFQAKEIGPVYDLGLATRDGSTLQVANRNGQLISVSQVAYMFGRDAQSAAKEETELEHKAALTRLASPNLTDREFDQWPQTTQGDWSGGLGQKVFNDPTRYWDGYGLRWPLTDYLITHAYLPAAVNAPASSSNPIAGCAGGQVSSYAAQDRLGNGAVFNLNNNGTSTLYLISDDTTWTLASPYGSPASATLYAADICIGGGYIWSVVQNGTALQLWGHVRNAGNVLATLSTAPIATLATLTTPVAGSLVARIASGYVGNQFMVVVAWTYYTGNQVITGAAIVNASTPWPAAVISIPMPYFNAGSDHSMNQISGVAFMGDQVVFAQSDGQDCYLLAYTVSSGTMSTIAVIRNGGGQAYITEVAGSLFVIACSWGPTVTSPGATSPLQNSVMADFYLLSGSQLQHLPQPPSGAIKSVSAVNYPLATVSRPATFGSYAIWAQAVYGTGLDGQSGYFLETFAYDATSGSIFKIDDPRVLIPPAPTPVGNSSAVPGWPLAVYGIASHTFGGATSYYSQWAVMLPMHVFTSNAKWYQELQVVPLYQGLTVYSSLIDFTYAEPKLFRQLVVVHEPIAANQYVDVTAWLDLDPASAETANSTLTVHNTTVGATQTVLPINKMARKLVYALDVDQVPSNPTVAVCRPISVGVQAATGWVWTVTLPLTPSLQLNGKAPGDYCFERQNLDQVAAYNFLRALWRQKGGQCVATLPNGDSFNASLQDLHFDTPKPLAVSARSDQPTGYQALAFAKLREDV